MEEISLREGEEFIKLGQLLKKAGMVGSGVDAKFVIQDGLVEVNGEVELQRGKKIYPDDVVSFNGESVKVIR
ncbi:MAG: RNA-binding S4 domain-containing protein [Lachnospiraceae bacterium]|jgi:ribosome-associated protein|nr:RNA-binding S4 domain-containing protein [Lachnospiraceae bacterium]MBO6155665.1 RNA-binding S4 domain-containing protein [Lachnospiraceae bacterium]